MFLWYQWSSFCKHLCEKIENEKADHPQKYVTQIIFMENKVKILLTQNIVMVGIKGMKKFISLRNNSLVCASIKFYAFPINFLIIQFLLCNSQNNINFERVFAISCMFTYFIWKLWSNQFLAGILIVFLTYIYI